MDQKDYEQLSAMLKHEIYDMAVHELMYSRVTK